MDRTFSHSPVKIYNFTATVFILSKQTFIPSNSIDLILTHKLDISQLRQEAGGLEELSRQLFLEAVDLHSTQVILQMLVGLDVLVPILTQKLLPCPTENLWILGSADGRSSGLVCCWTVVSQTPHSSAI